MHSPREVQRRVFEQMIDLAQAINKPIVVHTREAQADTLEVLSRASARGVGGVLHCFTEDRTFAERVLELGFDLSFSGIVTFKSARELQAVAAWAPADRVLVETDSPYLAPVPFRGRACEPAYVVHTARFIAALRGEPFEAFAERSNHNAIRRLGLHVV
jgi:TatD DNase family protein